MKLQQGTMCALLAVLHMASRPKELIPASDIARIYGVSQHHLAKVLRTLSLAGIVESTRGVGGGCSFIGDPRRITLYDIIILFERGWFHDPARISGEPSDVADELYRVIDEVDRHTAATLQSVTLQTIINNALRKKPRQSDLGVVI
jgi:Rrf2 family nitric oxide-sensitive transcriptional repressor